MSCSHGGALNDNDVSCIELVSRMVVDLEFGSFQIFWAVVAL